MLPAWGRHIVSRGSIVAFLVGALAAVVPVAVYAIKQTSVETAVVIFHATVLQYQTVNSSDLLLSFGQ
jgi:hypothetical protein